MKTGLVIGKFYPPHRGHKYLIDAAAKETDRLFVVVCRRQNQYIDVELRATWLRAIHPSANVLIAEDIQKDDDPHAWGAYIKEILGCTPDILFTSEEYGERYARILGARHVLVDQKRKAVPISATEIRKNPLRYAEYLEPCVLEYFYEHLSQTI